MPVYEYQCKACKRTFTVTMTMAEHEKRRPKCPRCGKRQAAQLMSGFVAQTSRKS
jgi:putative FmdB family regulatory protein